MLCQCHYMMGELLSYIQRWRSIQLKFKYAKKFNDRLFKTIIIIIIIIIIITVKVFSIFLRQFFESEFLKNWTDEHCACFFREYNGVIFSFIIKVSFLLDVHSFTHLKRVVLARSVRVLSGYSAFLPQYNVNVNFISMALLKATN